VDHHRQSTIWPILSQLFQLLDRQLPDRFLINDVTIADANYFELKPCEDLEVNKKKDTYDPEWAKAKRLCRLNQEDIRMAKELGFSPRSVMKNRPGKDQQWKAPVKYWIRDLYEKRQQKIEAGKVAKMKKDSPPGDAGSRPKSENNIEPEKISAEKREWDRLLESVPLVPTRQEIEILEGAMPTPTGEESDLFDDFFDDNSPPTREEIEEENIMMLRRQKRFRVAAKYVASEFAKFPWVEKVAIIGSVAVPLKKEVPRFSRFRRARVEIWHECKDVDLAVWASELGDLNALRKARSRAVNELSQGTDGFVSVAHHQVEVFIIKPGTKHYLGTLCIFNTCPKDKPDCLVTNCGAQKFLRQFEGFRLSPAALDPSRMIVLFSRERAQYDTQSPHNFKEISGHDDDGIPQDFNDVILRYHEDETSHSEDHEPPEYDDEIPF